jgi:hypothetical protein
VSGAGVRDSLGDAGLGEDTTLAEPGGSPSSQGRGYEYGGPAFPGGVLVGIGIGILTDDFWGWLLVGVGAGFILMGLIAALARR